MKFDDRPKRGGWDPGGYGRTCGCCGDEFCGDKRASYCADCAYIGSEIVGVAIIHDGTDYRLPRPNRHHDVIRLIAESGGRIPITTGQGFYDEAGNFLDREEARTITMATGQCPEPDHRRDLFSEDLWDKDNNDIHERKTSD